MQAPRIQTAIPRRRYALGDYEAVVLGEIDSPDAARYAFILALVREGERQPCFYVISERSRRSERDAGSHRLRVVSEAFTEDLGADDRWGELEAFSAEALALAARVLGLGDTEPMRLA